MLRVCLVCDVQYDADPGRLKHNRQTTCSRKCSYKLRSEKASEANRGRQSPLKGIKTGKPSWNKTAGVYIDCGHCRKEIRLEPNQVGKKKFCSKACFFAGRELKGLFEKGHANLVPPEKRGHNQETRQKIAEAQRLKNIKGEKHFICKGGLR